MKRLFITFIAMIAIGTINAQLTPRAILNGVISQFKADKGVSANIALTVENTTLNGEIKMYGDKFSIIFDVVKIWYDGKTMWSYTEDAGEVNITEPTNEELQMTSPYAIVESATKDFAPALLSSTDNKIYALKLIPTDADSGIREVNMTIDRKTNRLNKLLIITSDGKRILTLISKYKTKNSFSESTFKFNKNHVPSKTAINDLR